MGRGMFSFILVVAFIPAVLFSASMHARALEEISDKRVFLMEQQVLTNKEHEFEYTFWETAVKSVRAGKDLDESMGSWRGRMEEEDIHVWSGFVGSDFYDLEPEEYESILEVAPGKYSVEVWSEEPFSAVGASIRAGNSSTVFLIPAGCSRGV